MTDTITLPFDNRTYDRDRLATALVVYLDLIGEYSDTTTADLVPVGRTLRTAHGFTTDSITYALAARTCIEHGIEP